MQQALRFIKDETGVTAIEYGMIAGLVATGGVFALQEVGTTLNNFMNYTADQLHLPE